MKKIKGMTYKVVPIPDDLVAEATEWREKMLEALLNLMIKSWRNFLKTPESITEAEVLAALRKACLANKIVPMLCGSSFKNKGVQTMLDLVMELMPSPLDKHNIKGTNPDTERRSIS